MNIIANSFTIIYKYRAIRQSSMKSHKNCLNFLYKPLYACNFSVLFTSNKIFIHTFSSMEQKILASMVAVICISLWLRVYTFNYDIHSYV